MHSRKYKKCKMSRRNNKLKYTCDKFKKEYIFATENNTEWLNHYSVKFWFKYCNVK